MNTNSAIRVVLVDDHALVRSAIRMMIERDPDLTVVGEASDRATALAAARLHPDVILLDLDLGNECSLDFFPELQAESDGGKILILTGVINPDLQRKAVCLGAMGLILKTDSPESLPAAIKKIHAGEAWLHPATVASVLAELTQHREPKRESARTAKIVKITEREREVIALVGEGLRNKQIAERLFISEPTVRHYLTSIFDKVGVSDRLGLIIYAYQHGLAKLPTVTPNGKDVGKSEQIPSPQRGLAAASGDA